MEAVDAMRLLIVDDNPGIHRVIKSIVSDLADEIFDCIEGPKALAAYLAHRPDFVLMDFGHREGVSSGDRDDIVQTTGKTDWEIPQPTSSPVARVWA